MNRLTATAVALVALLATRAGPLTAQTQDACLAALRALNVPGAGGTQDNCRELAQAIWAANLEIQRASDRFLRPGDRNPATVFGERAFQQENPTHASLSGSLAQGDAVPAVTPTGLASGSLALVGSEGGDDALVALGLNPAVLFFINEASSALARYSRLMDLSVFVPLKKEHEESAEGDGGPDYVGARLRLNWLGAGAGEKLWQSADSLLTDWFAKSETQVQLILVLLREAPDLKACASALASNAEAPVINAGCGRPLQLGVDDNAAARLGLELERIRRSLDSRYFGADIRVDWGDPTLGAVENASGTFLFAGLAYGRRFTGADEGDPELGLRMRLGARHATLEHNDSTSFAVEGGLGLELARVLDQQEVTAAAGLEFRYGDGDGGSDKQFQTDYLVLRSSLVIPVTPSNSLSIAVGVPVAGAISSYLSVNFNWGLMLPGRSPATRR